ncbi:MAG: hypothetical protein ACI35S_04175 [Anaeroplasma sp.]
MVLFKLGIIEIDFGMIISFLIGLAIGALIICLVYAVVVVASLGSKKFIIKTQEDSLTVQEVKDMIVTAQKSFKDKSLRGDLSRVNHCKNLCKDLVYGIATRFFPNSKYPLLEISIDESVLLVGYIQKRIDEILDKKGIRLLKRIKIASIVSLSQKTANVVDSKIFQVGKDLNGAVSIIKKAANVLNPAWWFRQLFIDKTVNIILNKLCLVILAVVGEETYKIYSKKVFDLDISIDSDVDKLIDSIDKEIADVRDSVNRDVNEEYVTITTPEENNYNFKRKVYINSSDKIEYISIYSEKNKLKSKKTNEIRSLEYEKETKD